MSHKKDHTKTIKLQIVAGKATPAPPVGPILGSAGINIVAFCKAFNDKTRSLGDIVVTAVISVDLKKKDFKFEVKKPPMSALIKKTIGIDKGSKFPNREKVSKITQDQLMSIAKEKMEDLQANSVEAAMRIVAGSARSMGIDVVG